MKWSSFKYFNNTLHRKWNNLVKYRSLNSLFTTFYIIVKELIWIVISVTRYMLITYWLYKFINYPRWLYRIRIWLPQWVWRMGIWICSRQKLTSPKWNRFKGIRLRWKDKIRLNNVIWRCWHMQCKRKKKYLASSASRYILKINRRTLRDIFWFKFNLSLRKSIFVLLRKCGITQLISFRFALLSPNALSRVRKLDLNLSSHYRSKHSIY